jgi:preprotein translocase subunit SecA
MSGGRGLTGRDAIAAAAGAAVPAGVAEAGQMAAEAVEAQPALVETRRLDDSEKIGRNDPCWCGSGKKFKKCHGA